MLENVSYKTIQPEEDTVANVTSLDNEDASYPSIVSVTTEEVVLVTAAVLLWVACVILFVNKWGKIRMMEPYHPDYHSSDYPSVKKQSIRDMSEEGPDDGNVADEIALELLRGSRIRQNSMFAFESSKTRSFDKVTPRRYKSAEDILSLVVHVEELQEVQEEDSYTSEDDSKFCEHKPDENPV